MQASGLMGPAILITLAYMLLHMNHVVLLQASLRYSPQGMLLVARTGNRRHIERGWIPGAVLLLLRLRRSGTNRNLR